MTETLISGGTIEIASLNSLFPNTKSTNVTTMAITKKTVYIIEINRDIK